MVMATYLRVAELAKPEQVCFTAHGSYAEKVGEAADAAEHFRKHLA
jgi:hypothetical protein